MKRLRNWMSVRTDVAKENRNVSDLKDIALQDLNILAHLMNVSYQETIDHEGETFEQCVSEMRDTIMGKYGPFVPEASKLILRDGKAAAGCLITMWKGKPLIAFSMTDPDYQRQGLSKFLILEAMKALSQIGEQVLYLVVTDGNTPAQALYRKIGFKDLGEALPGQPPPLND